MRIFLFAITLTGMAIALTACGRTGSSGAADAELSRLDSLIDQHDIFEKKKLNRISDLRAGGYKAVTPSEQYLFSDMMFNEFLTLKADSAAKYVDRCIAIAQDNGNEEWEAKSKINKAEMLTGTGLLHEAEEVMLSINASTLPESLKVAYYGQKIYLYGHLGFYAGGEGNIYFDKERAYKDSIMQVITPSHPEYLWYKAGNIAGTDRTDPEVVKELKKRVDSSKHNTRQDAKEAYILAKLFEQSGDLGNAMKYMATSAIADVRIANAEIASLEELAQMVFNGGKGDIDRAYSYVNYSMNKALTYPNRARSIGITRIMDQVNKAYQERMSQQQHRNEIAFIVVCILALILISSLITIILQNRRLRKQSERLDNTNKSLNDNVRELSEAHEKLNAANERLRQLNEDLRHKNDQLNEASYVKEEYMGYLFSVCSNYIGKLENLRQSVYAKAVSKKYKEIVEDTQADIMKTELKEFYHSFDTIFLNIYPDFISDFNSLLQEDKRIVPKEGELLNTELRIYALVRLGITDSVKIAEFLHCSPQTVYNNRFRVRNKAIIDKKDFAETVRTLGKYSCNT
ncbi:MAG: transcriptional regulator [Muribaculaceae bacterium]|nr:transcriptional regulator [Muribaculaceae bacterium]